MRVSTRERCYARVRLVDCASCNAVPWLIVFDVACAIDGKTATENTSRLLGVSAARILQPDAALGEAATGAPHGQHVATRTESIHVDARTGASSAESRSTVNSPAAHYHNLRQMCLVSDSSSHVALCIQLLPPPNLGSDPAHTLSKAVGDLKFGTKEDGVAGVQATWLEALGAGASRWPDSVGGKALTLTFADTHQSPFSNGRKPDNSHFARGNVAGHGHTAVVAIGDLKARVRRHFTPQSKGELLDMVERFLVDQPDTTGMTAYLTDGRWIQFFRVNRAPGTVQGFTYIEGPLFILQTSAGQQWFWGLMTTSVEALGWNGPQLHIGTTPLTVVRLLGSGSTGRVYHCTYAQTEDGGGDDAAAGAGRGRANTRSAHGTCTQNQTLPVCQR